MPRRQIRPILPPPPTLLRKQCHRHQFAHRQLDLRANGARQLDQGEEPCAFKDALAFYTRAGYRTLWAETPGYFAESLVERGTTADRAKAAQLVRDAIPAAEELGMKPLSSKLQLLHETVADLSGEYPDGLSGREVEVLRLIAAGRSNQKIADDLFLSRYTVVRHVSNIFGKIGAGNRAEAATNANRHGLVDETAKI
ncbi:MAG: response regulator transcription factor [Chloroflexi bacterium]|nr:response regulator transcription factor [Chloroflexota bacterium]